MCHLARIGVYTMTKTERDMLSVVCMAMLLAFMLLGVL